MEFNTPKKENAFLSALATNSAKGQTANGAVTFTNSGSHCLDFFSQAGAMRENQNKALELFQKAFIEDNLTAIRILFYLRDIRGGQGERQLFRNCLQWLGENYPDIFKKIIGFVPEYGRYDDIFFDNEIVWDTVSKQLEADKVAVNPSLLAKWIPTINASSDKTRAKARFIANKLNLSDIAYRKLIRSLRAKIKTVEEKMSARKWEDINYSAVPSRASKIYSSAFKKHDEKKYAEFIEKAKNGEVKINASTLYPYELYDEVNNGKYSNTTEALWRQLPDYTQGKNAIVVADVSGSMSGRPMSVSVSLALYFAERNQGQFKDYWINFSNKPTLQKLIGKTLKEKMLGMDKSNWDMNTDLQAVFDLILNTAINNSTPQEELPETIYIISDMEFDSCCDDHTNFEHIKIKYEKEGYNIPNLVFWNINASGANVPVRKNEQGVSLVSGFSPSIFKIAVENRSPIQIMNETVNGERYQAIQI